MEMTQNEYKQFRKDGQSSQAAQREEVRRQNIDVVEKQKDRKLQYKIFIASIISAIAAVIAAISSIIK